MYLSLQLSFTLKLKIKKLIWALLLCRSSLLPGVEKLVYGSYVKVLPTEDFLALRVLARFSSHMLRMKHIPLGCTIIDRISGWSLRYLH
jgi:hypothetical protein